MSSRFFGADDTDDDEPVSDEVATADDTDEAATADDSDRLDPPLLSAPSASLSCPHRPSVAAAAPAPAPPPDTEHARQVQSWAVRVPIGLGLCPWAGKAHFQGRLRYVTCAESSPADAAQLVAAEAAVLTGSEVAPLSSSLVVCPHVTGWQEFTSFEDWVAGLEKSCEGLTLVPFHPDFLRWCGLPDGVGVGSVVVTHWGDDESTKSVGTAPATIIDSGDRNPFGMRKVLVRFHESLDGRTPEQFVPIDWLVHSHRGAPLPDNGMHQAPHPTIHLIRSADLASLTLCDVSRVKRQNAQRMLKLGWEGVSMKRCADEADYIDARM